ncbi:hypothetical protein BJ684DRAFT_15324 [Piptocephalis cylindrospora]|uniref:Uncharacterized protein n=1 Tax=Piptocephalis cylindrospora TaxID=1907219 RepID=A0A4P9Y5W0_9FUNG|nr:hypothetical protein BJ684DRAFT_15324 [Piptocephalis cylindrospora]|eukprot:RKP14343.1 hypothetical protein BJ684DRAFT_15324 [Piptocephalis cylindrospora]
MQRSMLLLLPALSLLVLVVPTSTSPINPSSSVSSTAHETQRDTLPEASAEDAQVKVDQGEILTPGAVQRLLKSLELDASINEGNKASACRKAHHDVSSLGPRAHSEAHIGLLLRDALCQAVEAPEANMAQGAFSIATRKADSHQLPALKLGRTHFENDCIPFAGSALQDILSKDPETLSSIISAQELLHMDKALYDLTFSLDKKGWGWPHSKTYTQTLKHKMTKSFSPSERTCSPNKEDRNTSRLQKSLDHVELMVDDKLKRLEERWRVQRDHFDLDANQIKENLERLATGESMKDFLDALSQIWQTFLGRALLHIQPSSYGNGGSGKSHPTNLRFPVALPVDPYKKERWLKHNLFAHPPPQLRLLESNDIAHISDFLFRREQAKEIPSRSLCKIRGHMLMHGWGGSQAVEQMLGIEAPEEALDDFCFLRPSYPRGLLVEWMDDLLAIAHVGRLNNAWVWGRSTFVVKYTTKYSGGKVRLNKTTNSPYISSSMREKFKDIAVILDKAVVVSRQRDHLPYAQKQAMIPDISKYVPLVVSVPGPIPGFPRAHPSPPHGYPSFQVYYSLPENLGLYRLHLFVLVAILILNEDYAFFLVPVIEYGFMDDR